MHKRLIINPIVKRFGIKKSKNTEGPLKKQQNGVGVVNSIIANGYKNFKLMPKRTSVNDVKEIEDLNDLERLVKDKRNDKRSDAKKERRNRHYIKVLIKTQLKGDDFEE
jgi:dTDP-glucose pyrophosphorylase